MIKQLHPSTTEMIHKKTCHCGNLSINGVSILINSDDFLHQNKHLANLSKYNILLNDNSIKIGDNSQVFINYNRNQYYELSCTCCKIGLAIIKSERGYLGCFGLKFTHKNRKNCSNFLRKENLPSLLQGFITNSSIHVRSPVYISPPSPKFNKEGFFSLEEVTDFEDPSTSCSDFYYGSFTNQYMYSVSIHNE